MNKRYVLISALTAAVMLPASAPSQTSLLVPTATFHAIRDASSGELPLVDFQYIVTHFSGFSPSKGGDQIAEYIASRMREYGLDEVAVEGFPADGKTFYWAFLPEPAWEAETAVLTMVQPRSDRLADYSLDRGVIGRYSTSADVTRSSSSTIG